MISINLFCLGNRCEGRRWKAHAHGGDDQADAHQAGVVRDQVHKEALSSSAAIILIYCVADFPESLSIMRRLLETSWTRGQPTPD